MALRILISLTDHISSLLLGEHNHVLVHQVARQEVLTASVGRPRTIVYVLEKTYILIVFPLSLNSRQIGRSFQRYYDHPRERFTGLGKAGVPCSRAPKSPMVLYNDCEDG